MASKMSFWNKLKKPIMVLAPMADVTDPAFRYIIAKYSKYDGQDIGEYGKFIRPPLEMVGGPDVIWTEFVSADGLFLGGREALIKDLTFTEAERPIVAQFFSSKPEMMFKAALLAVELGFDGIDINMGCPDRSVEKQGAGAALIKNPLLAVELIKAAQQGALRASLARDKEPIPVSVKTRIGYNKNELETWLPAILKTNPAVVTIHARTRKEMSSVPARWEHVKRAVEIRNELKSETLIFGNGDVVDTDDGKKKCEETGADGAMIGSAIFGNPWLFAKGQTLRVGSQRSDLDRIKQILSVLVEHTNLFEKLCAQKNFAVMKKHFKAYVNGRSDSKSLQTRTNWNGAKELRLQLMETKNAREVEEKIQKYLSSLK